MKKNPGIIVCFTTLPDRLSYIEKTIESIVEQSLKPDKIVLYLCEDDFNEIPSFLIKLEDKYDIFDVKLVKENYRSATKLIPALDDYPDDILINIDDDLIYKSDLIKNLVDCYRQFGDKRIYSVAGHRLYFDNKQILHKGYEHITYEYDGYDCSFLSGHGTLYPPHIFDGTKIKNFDLMKKMCVTHDELWFWANAVINGIKTHVIGRYAYCHDWAKEFHVFKNALCKTNRPNVEDRYFESLQKYIQANNPNVLKLFSQPETDWLWRFSENSKTKIAIISAATSNLKYQYNVTNRFKVSYAKKYGYDFIFQNITSDKKQSYFARQELIRKDLKVYDYVMWMDADAWFNNFQISLDGILKEMEINNKILCCSRDHFTIKSPKKYHESYINSGVLLFKSCEKAFNLLDAWQYPSTETKAWMAEHTGLNDQPFLCIQLFFNDTYKDCALITEPLKMNCFVKCYPYSKDVFVYHGAGCKANLSQRLIEYLKESCKNNKIFMEKYYEEKKSAPQVKNDIFVPRGFEFHPTLKPVTDYNKPFKLIDWGK